MCALLADAHEIPPYPALGEGPHTISAGEGRGPDLGVCWHLLASRTMALPTWSLVPCWLSSPPVTSNLMACSLGSETPLLPSCVENVPLLLF